MTVFDILVVSLGFSRDGSHVLGDVRFDLQDASGTTRTMTFSCECTASKRIPPHAILIGDAIRQLRRLPEIRNGDAKLRFARGLKPLTTAQAA